SVRQLYGTSLALLTDLYQLTMAHGYWKEGLSDWESTFHLFFRENPFGSGYAVACGLEDAVAYLQGLRFQADDLEYLSGLTGGDGKALFDPNFLKTLGELRFSCDVDAVPEGTVVFPHEPLIRLQGPLWQCQLVETALLTIINFQTLVATKAARVCQAAAGDMVIEFGLRRAQGIDGGVSASRASFVGGCAATSNVLAGKLLGIPTKGTHAHSWVMSFDSEQEAFDAYARAMPNNCVFLVDTYDTAEGVRKAVTVGKRLRQEGHEMVGIRLDSGDLTQLSIEARRILDEGGFPDAAVVASSDLDEYRIEESKRRGGKINVWGVGTRMATAYDQPALGGVYKIGAIRKPGESWTPKIKLSNEPAKTTNPGIQQVRRFRSASGAAADVIYDQEQGVAEPCRFVSLHDVQDASTIPADCEFEDLLVPLFRHGKLVANSPSLTEIQERARGQLAMFSDEVKRFQDPERYPVGLEQSLHERKIQLMQAASTTSE
ncbi:MAG: nicotinate phosphoribosyltransferase, partial [Planctomycetales bacterium]